MRFGSGLALVAIIALSGPAIAQTTNEQTPQMQPITDKQLGLVKIGNQTALRLTDAETLTAEQRANQARAAILTALRADGQATLGQFDIQEAVAVDTQGEMPVVTVNERPVVVVTAADTRIQGMTADELADRWEQGIQSALASLELTPETRIANLDERFTVAVTGVGEPIQPEAAVAARDERIAAGVRNSLITDETFREAGLADEIRVEVVDGAVTLWGDVAAEDVSEELVERVQDMPGVKSVVNMVGREGATSRQDRF